MSIILIISILLILIGGIYEETFRVNLFFVSIGFTLVAIAYGCIVVFAITEKDNFLKRITSNSGLIFFGKISFGLYIFHWPIYLTMFSLTNFLVQKSGLIFSANYIQLINIVASFTLVTIISFLSFKYYESIFLKWKIKPEQPKILI